MLSHLEFEQVKRALDRMRCEDANGYNRGNNVKKDEVIEILMPYVEGFVAPNPHPVTSGVGVMPTGTGSGQATS
jgi:hypothetical protein